MVPSNKNSKASSSMTSRLSSNTDSTTDRQHDESNPFDFSPEDLAGMLASRDIEMLESLGGIDGLERGLKTSLIAGIPQDEFASFDNHGYGTINRPATPRARKAENHASRIAAFGENQLPERPTKSLFRLMIVALDDKVLLLLTAAAFFSLALGLYQTFGQPHGPGQPRVEWVEGVSILVAVIIAVAVGALNDWQKEHQFAKLNRKRNDRSIKVTRSGKPMEIPIHDILVGDVIHLNAGDVAPVDGVLIKGYNVKCDESSLTGETRAIKKTSGQQLLERMSSTGNLNSLDPFIVSSSTIIEGTGTYLATCIGAYSTHGRLLLSLTQEEDPTTPLQKKLAVVADQIALAAFAVALILFLTLFTKFLASLPSSTDSPYEKGQTFLQILIVCIAIVVVAVPEGLPLAVTLALAIAVVRMLKDNNLVRILSACETMGNATVVCCDKTGTLTMNEMTVTSGIIGPKMKFGYAEDDDTAQTIPLADLASRLSPEMRELICQSIVLNSTAFETEKDGKSMFVGQRTEVALLDFAKERLGIRPVNQERSNADVVEVVPFDSQRKYMACVVRISKSKYRLLVKGAPEILLEKCTNSVTAVTESLKSTVLGADMEPIFKSVIHEYANHSLRTIGFAYHDLSSWPPAGAGQDSAFEDSLEQLTFIGIVGIQDPLRPGVRDAVKRCQHAGVGVKMVTGDNLGTAKAIARESGILRENGLVMEGARFRKLSSDEMNEVVPRLQVLARSSPDDKRILVQKLKELGQTVAVTGDGTNDGPALRAADVGFSMGLSGTEVAKEASSIVLIDDNFSSIVKAIEWGRTVNDAIRKFLQFQLTVNITAVTLTFVSAISSSKEESILTPVQLLWVNLIMDTFAALALATDPVNPEVLNRKPEGKTAPLLNINMWKMIIGQSIYQLIIVLTLNFAGDRAFGYTLITNPYERSTHGTMVFNTYVWMQFFNQYNNRRLDNKLNVFEGLLQNWYFIVINVITAVGQVIIVLYGGDALSTVPLNAKEWVISLLLGATSLPVAVFIRLIPNEWVTMCFPGQAESEDTTSVSTPGSPLPWMQDVEQQQSVSSFEAGVPDVEQVRSNSSEAGAPDGWIMSLRSSPSYVGSWVIGKLGWT